MISINEVIEEIKTVLNSKKRLNENYELLSKTLLNNYKKFDSNILIEDFVITKKHHYLSFKKDKNDDYIFIDLTNHYLELRFLSLEKMVFFDQCEFEKLLELLKSFFEGQYHITIYNKGNSIIKEIIWIEDSLKCFNEKYEVYNSIYTNTNNKKLQGIVLIDK